MLLKKYLLISAFACTLLAGAAYSEGWATGFGATPEAAIQNAMDNAAKIVASRKAGCVGPGKSGGDTVKYLGKENGLYKFQAVYSFHNGSCGIKKSPGEIAHELGIT